jgi:EpsD family peptidyl-prolyl cis-trans isomerase
LLYVSRNLQGRWRIAATICALIAAVALGSCGKKQDTQAAVGQVIAHVGPDDVTQQEVDNELRLANVPADKRSDEVVKAILSRIIERKYLVQQATAAKLDREPTVHLDLLRSREQILAGAYIQRDLGAKATGISKNEVAAYIQAQPDQFATRQVYQIEQISFPPQKDMEALAAATKDFNSLNQVEAKLNQLDIKFTRGTATMDSATLPPEMKKAIDARKPDDVFFFRSRTSATYFKVTSVDDKPLTVEDDDQFATSELQGDLARITSFQRLTNSCLYLTPRTLPQATEPPPPDRSSEESDEDEKGASPKLPEENLLYFLEKNSPVLKAWQREIMRIVRHLGQ